MEAPTNQRSSVPLKDKIQVRYLSVIVDICGDVPDITIATCGVFVDNGPVRLRSCAHKLPNVNVDVLVCFHCSLLLWYAYPHRRVFSKRFLFPHDSLCQRVVSSGNVLTYPPMERLKNGTAYRSASCRPLPEPRLAGGGHSVRRGEPAHRLFSSGLGRMAAEGSASKR